jgi:patatin-like phospholipase/acyl hydrolase
MCATLADKGESILLRSYSAPEDSTPVSSIARQASDEGAIEGISISTAARATSAAPTYLPEVVWKGMTFWDGGLLNNNPISQLWASRYDLVGPKEEAPPVSLVLSLGTSWDSTKPNSFMRIVNTLNKATSFMTNTEAKHRDFLRYVNRLRSRQKENSKTEYFRFNTSTGREAFNLDDYQKMKRLRELTMLYLETPEVKADITRCADILLG